MTTNVWTKTLEEKHPIYVQILRNRPNINKTYAMKLSNTIHDISIKHDIPKHIYTAILAQESLYKLNAKACQKGYMLNSKTITTVCTDFGVSQLHWKNIQKLNLDIDLLLTDMLYSVEQGAKILAYFKKRYGKTDKLYWSRYNAKSLDKRKEYERLVRRFL